MKSDVGVDQDVHVLKKDKWVLVPPRNLPCDIIPMYIPGIKSSCKMLNKVNNRTRSYSLKRHVSELQYLDDWVLELWKLGLPSADDSIN